ncbi:peptidase M4 family protein [Cystobacter fuscus]
MGDDIWTPATPGDALRYMANPTQDGYSYDYYPERYTGTGDGGGVHRNSGIPNLAFKLLTTGGTHPRGKTSVQVPGIGIQKAGAIFYKANAEYFTASTTFLQAKTYTAQAATDLGYDAAAVTAAWDAVGVDGRHRRRLPLHVHPHPRRGHHRHRPERRRLELHLHAERARGGEPFAVRDERRHG